MSNCKYYVNNAVTSIISLIFTSETATDTIIVIIITAGGAMSLQAREGCGDHVSGRWGEIAYRLVDGMYKQEAWTNSTNPCNPR